MGTRLLDTDVLIEIRAKLLFDESHLPGSYAHRLAHSHWSLDLSGDHRFSASWGACLGGSAHEGAWRLEGDVLILEPDPPCDLDDLHGMATRYIPVWWGNRHLLVTEIQIPALCADARGKAPPQEARVNGLYLVKVLASGAPAGMGAPVVPKRFRHFYESGPIRAQVVRVNDDGTVTLDKGSDDRLQVGMWLTIGWFRDDIEAEVISVSEHSAVARAYYSQRSERRIAPGERLTTGERGQYPLHAARERLTEPPPPRPRITIRHKDTGAILQRFYAPTEDQALHISGDLQGADLREAGPGSDAPLNLVGAVGWFAHLQGAVMEGQNLAEAGFHCGELEGANARSANLEGADLSDANLRRIILAGANLTDANLQKSDLTDADLSGAGLCRALLGSTDLRGADLTGTDLRHADLTFARFDRHTRWPPGFDPAAARRGPGRSTNLRSYVSFRANRNEIPFGYQGTRESLRSLLAKALGDLGVAVDRFSFDYPCSAPTRINGQERYIDHDWVNSFRCFSDGLRFHVLVGSPGGWFFKEDREWLVTVHPVRGIVATLLWWKAEEACRTVCRRIHQILKADRRFTRVKWHTENEWNTDPETDWSEAP